MLTQLPAVEVDSAALVLSNGPVGNKASNWLEMSTTEDCW
jgi:hypothetical protein